MEINNRLKAIFICFSGKWNFTLFIFIATVSSLFDILILALISFYILGALSLSDNVGNLNMLSTSTQFYIDILLENLIILLFARFILIFIRILFEYNLRIKFTEFIRNKTFIMSSKHEVYSKITQSPIADFTSRITSWQLGANGLFNALTSIFSNIAILIIAPLWILKIADIKLVMVLLTIFTTAVLLIGLIKKTSVTSYKKAVKVDVEVADRLLYLFNDWRVLESISETQKMTGKASLLITNFARQMARSEVYIALIRPLLEITLIATICGFFMLATFGIGLKIEENLQIGLITLRLIPAISGVLAGYTGIANNFVYYDHICEYDGKHLGKQEFHVNKTLSLDLFKVEKLTIDIQKPIQTKFVLDSSSKQTKLLNITGKSGVGKSILCDICVGLIPWSGELICDGEKTQTSNQYTKMFDAAYLTQNTKLHKQSVREYLGPERIWKKLAVVQQIIQLFPFVGSLNESDYIGTDARSLSGGQTQIIRLIKALERKEAQDVSIKTILIDEGLSGIPFSLRSKLLNILMDCGYNVIHITHDANDNALEAKELKFEV